MSLTRKKRGLGQGKGREKGKTKQDVVLYLANEGDWISRGDIQYHLKKSANINSTTTVLKCLESLEAEGYVEGDIPKLERQGRTTRYRLTQKLEGFIKILNFFKNNPELIIRSKYGRKILDPSSAVASEIEYKTNYNFNLFNKSNQFRDKSYEYFKRIYDDSIHFFITDSIEGTLASEVALKYKNTPQDKRNLSEILRKAQSFFMTPISIYYLYEFSQVAPRLFSVLLTFSPKKEDEKVSEIVLDLIPKMFLGFKIVVESKEDAIYLNLIADELLKIYGNIPLYKAQIEGSVWRYSKKFNVPTRKKNRGYSRS